MSERVKMWLVSMSYIIRAALVILLVTDRFHWHALCARWWSLSFLVTCGNTSVKQCYPPPSPTWYPWTNPKIRSHIHIKRPPPQKKCNRINTQIWLGQTWKTTMTTPPYLSLNKTNLLLYYFPNSVPSTLCIMHCEIPKLSEDDPGLHIET